MELVQRPEAFRRTCERARAADVVVGLVPTMGALHEGHLALVREAARHAGHVAVSIFVNPTQFGPSEDLDRYPRTLEADCAQCERAGVAVVFAPERADMYPPGEETRVRVAPTAAALCGEHRPGHFEGVATIVTKLFALAGPSVAVFGRKDYQQLQVIRRLVGDLLLPVRVIGVPTVREADGLALSSRNRYLAPAERERALAIPRALSEAAEAFAAGERRAERLRQLVLAPLGVAASSIDYVELADPDTVIPYPRSAHVADRALLAVAARIGHTRLIDNVVLGEDPAPLAASRTQSTLTGGEGGHAG
jgi:pantoate--beta-alanine ligase